jgi:hypothetical protein
MVPSSPTRDTLTPDFVPLNDCLSLYPVQALNRQPLSTGWRIAFASLGEGEDLGFPQIDFDDDGWPTSG